MEGAISKGEGISPASAGNAEEGRVSTARWNPKGMRRSSGPQSMGAIPTMNRSAKEGTRSSRHYGDEGAIHPPLEPWCVRAARSGRTRRDPRRSQWMLDAQGALSEDTPISR
jgi:ribosomal protein L32